MSLKVVILLGPPGVGKGTQASLIVKNLNAVHLSTGNLIRSQIASGSSLGLRVKNIVDAGEYVDDHLVMECVESFIKDSLLNKEFEFLVVDGLPRNLSQIDLLSSLLAKHHFAIDFVISLSAEPDALVSRFSKRYLCSKCNESMSIDAFDSTKQYICPKCENVGFLVRRKDDDEVVVRHRMKIYLEETQPVIDAYKKSSSFYELDGLRDSSEIFKNISKILLKSKD